MKRVVKTQAWLLEQIRAAKPETTTGPDLPLDNKAFLKCSVAIERMCHPRHGRHLRFPSAALPPLF